MTTMVHAENADLIDFMTAKLESEGLTDPKYHAISHPASAEAEATNRAVVFSTIMDSPILIVHVSIPESTSVIRKAQTKLQPIFAETCPQYLLLEESKLAQEHFHGAKFICSPPLRTDPRDIEAIWQGIINGTFTIFSSDHCPYTYVPHAIIIASCRIADVLFQIRRSWRQTTRHSERYEWQPKWNVSHCAFASTRDIS
jgi:dihydropyrimidinase